MNDPRFRPAAAALMVLSGCIVEQDICPSGYVTSRSVDRCVLLDAGALDPPSSGDPMQDAGADSREMSPASTARMDGGTYASMPTPVQWFDVTGPGEADIDAPVAAISAAAGRTQIFWAHGGKIRTSRRISPVGSFSEGRDITNAGAIGRSGRITAVLVEFEGMRLFWATDLGAVRAKAEPWSDALGGEYSWLEIAPNGAAAKNATVAAVANSSARLSTYWIGPYGAIQGRRQSDGREEEWLPVEEIAPPGPPLEPTITAIDANNRAVVHLFFLVRAENVRMLGTKLGTLDASPRWSRTQVFVPPNGVDAAAVDISAVRDMNPGQNLFTTLAFPTPQGNFHGEAVRCDARDGGSNMCSTIPGPTGDASYEVPVTRVTAVDGKSNTYVFLRHSDNSLLMVCEPSCGGPFIVAGKYEIPSSANVTAVTDAGDASRITLFYTRADGRVRAATFGRP